MGYAAGDQNLYRYVENNPTDKTDPSGLADDLLDAGSALLTLQFGPFFGHAQVAGKIAEWRTPPPTEAERAAQAALWAPRPDYANAEPLRAEPKYTKHDIEWYAELRDISNPANPKIVLGSYVGFDVVSDGGKPVLKQKNPIAGTGLVWTAPGRNLAIHSQYLAAHDGTGKELTVTYLLTVTDQNDPWYSAKLEAKWKFTVKDNKVVPQFLGATPTVANPKTLEWRAASEPGKTNQETYTQQWQEETAAFGLYGPKKK